MSKVVIIENDKVTDYPDKSTRFSPSIHYPEYLWPDSTISSKDNIVYDLVRESIHEMGYDTEHYGTPDWNPFGDFVQQGQTVLVKPNWVEHENSNKEVDDNLRCLVTNPAVVRAVVDYVAIALKGTGKIIIADAPMQRCDLEKMFRIAGYNELFEFYNNQGLNYEIADLRKYHVDEVAHHVFTKPILTENSEGILVEMGGASMHAEKDGQNPKYKVSEYELTNTGNYHSGSKHCYEVNKLSLEADVIINVPKPKTHRLAGITAACKNFVGITYEKACLPHRILGDKAHGGDAYNKASIWKRLMEKFEEKKVKNSVRENYRASKFYWFLTKVAYVIGAYTSGDKFRIGSWYGNDTIWRTAIDLNFILLHADKQGMLHDDIQRKIVTIGDMIVAGQKSGPVGPTPKPLGIIMMSDNTLLFDRVVCEVMGFKHQIFPAFHHLGALNKMGFANFEELQEYQVYYNGWKNLKDFKEKEEWHFEAHPCWKGYIEK